MSAGIDPLTSSAIVISGVGVITPLGDTFESLLSALHEGLGCVVPKPESGNLNEARIAQFDATRYANVRGMRVYNRTTQLAICAAKRALTQSGCALSGEALGIVFASTFGHLDTLLEYDASLWKSGIQRTNPALMPLAISSAPGAATALSLDAKAFSVTLGGGATSSLDALAHGVRLLQSGRAQACVVVAAFSPCRELTISASRAGMLATADRFRVFDRLHEGNAFGEAAVALVLEPQVQAKARDATIFGRIRGHAAGLALEPSSESNLETTLRRVCGDALRAAGVAADALGFLSAGANGTARTDDAEARALLGLLGAASGRPCVSAVKGSLGEALDASGLLQVLVALGALLTGAAPGIVGLDEPAIGGLRYLTRSGGVAAGPALISAISHTGTCSALVLDRTPGS